MEIHENKMLQSLEINTADCSSTDASKLRKRVLRLLKNKENKKCSDCSKSNPRWITILSVPPPYAANDYHHPDTYLLGGFCCLECSGAHRRLGTHISFVRSVDLDSLTEKEVKALECGGGNETVNKIFEGKIFDTSVSDTGVAVSYYTSEIKPDASSTQNQRESFIRNKYEKKTYLNLKELSKFRQSMNAKERAAEPTVTVTDLSSPTSSVSSSKSEATSPLKLQVFTSSPRTLAMIEKYMNPKPKRKNIGRMIKNSLRRLGPRSAKKRYVKKSLQGLQGVVSLNTNVNIVETRSLEFENDDDSSDAQSITSTRSSISAFLRRMSSSKSSTRSLKGFDRYKPLSKNINRTVTLPKSERKRFLFRKRQNKRKQNNPQMSEEELEVFQINCKNPEIQTPLSPQSCKSPLFRLSPYLRTPKHKNMVVEVDNNDKDITSPLKVCSPYQLHRSIRW